MPNSMIPQGIIDDLRRFEENSMPEDGTEIVRTGQILPCRVTDTTQKQHIEGTPTFMQLRIWELSFKVGSDLKQGDTVIVPSKGTYLVTLVSFVASFSAAAVGYAIKLYDANGSLDILTNYANATFTSNDTNEVITTAVFAWQPDKPLLSQDNLPLYGWSVLFDRRLRYVSRTPPSNLPIGPSDLLWLPFMGMTGPEIPVIGQPISKPYPHELIPQLAIAHFNDKP